MKILLGTLFLVLGVVGILMAAAGNLPPELDVPILNTVITILGIALIGLGWMDELETGKTSIIDAVKKFFMNDPYRKLALTLLLAVANEIVQIGGLPRGFTTGAQIFMAIAGVFNFGASYADYRAKLILKRLK